MVINKNYVHQTFFSLPSTHLAGNIFDQQTSTHLLYLPD